MPHGIAILCLLGVGAAACGDKDQTSARVGGGFSDILNEDDCLDMAPAPPRRWWEAPDPCPDGTTFVEERFLQASIERCVDGENKNQGPFAVWDSDSSVWVVVNYKDGNEHGEWVRWSGDRIDHYVQRCQGMSHGLSLSFSGADLYRMGTFSSSRQTGTWLTFYENGVVSVEETWLDGLQHGVFRKWDRSGTLLHSLAISNGTGDWKQWFDDGTLWRTGLLRGGKPHGPWQSWHANGQLRSEERYDEGEKVGRWREWHPNGRPRVDVTWVDGEPTEAHRWDEQGAEIPYALTANP